MWTGPCPELSFIFHECFLGAWHVPGTVLNIVHAILLKILTTIWAQWCYLIIQTRTLRPKAEQRDGSGAQSAPTSILSVLLQAARCPLSFPKEELCAASGTELLMGLFNPFQPWRAVKGFIQIELFPFLPTWENWDVRMQTADLKCSSKSLCSLFFLQWKGREILWR